MTRIKVDNPLVALNRSRRILHMVLEHGAHLDRRWPGAHQDLAHQRRVRNQVTAAQVGHQRDGSGQGIGADAHPAHRHRLAAGAFRFVGLRDVQLAA